MSFNIDVSQLTGLKAQLRAFGAKVKSEVAMEGVAGMALVIYEDVRSRVRISSTAHYFHGRQFKKNGIKYLIQPGTLKNAIYRVYSPEKSSDTFKLYRVSWNHKKAPHGFMVEYGTSKMEARPFMRPATSRLPDAITAGKLRMAAKLKELESRR